MSVSIADDMLDLLALHARKDNESLKDYVRRLSDALRLNTISFDPASDIARNDNKWGSWKSSAAVYGPAVLSKDPTPGAMVIQSQLELIQQRVKYPGRLRHLLEARCAQCKSEYQIDYREEDAFIRNIVEWSKTVEHSKWDDNLSPDVLKLFLSWLATRRALDTDSYELAQRAVADMLVQAVFSERLADESPHDTHRERDIQVPVTPDSQFQLSRAKADVCTSKNVPKEVRAIIATEFLRQPRLLRIMGGLQCLAPEGTQSADILSLGTFFCEWKRVISIEIAARQGAFHGLGMQDQRQTLGLPSRPVYGLALAAGILHLVITTWEYSALAVRYTTGDLTWDLRRPSKLVECFYFLCALKAQIDEDFDTDMKEMMSKSGNDIVNWDLLETRVRNWQVSSGSRTSTRKSKSKGGGSQRSRSEDGQETNPEPSDTRPAKKRRHRDDDQNDKDNELPGRSAGGQGNDDKDGDAVRTCSRNDNNESNTRGRGQGENQPSGGQGKDDIDTAVSNRGTSENDSHFEDSMSITSDASGRAISDEEENRRCASIANWRVGKSYPVFDLEAWRRDASTYLFG